MATRVSSHIYRDRHGTFYFRLLLPTDLQSALSCREKRFSLLTQTRSTALIRAMPAAAARHELFALLRNMKDSKSSEEPTCKEQLSQLYRNWLAEVRKNYALREAFDDLKEQFDALTASHNLLMHQHSKTVQIETAKAYMVKAHAKGKTDAVPAVTTETVRQVLAENSFPWPVERTPMFSDLMSRYLQSLTYRPKHGRKKPPSDASLKDYRPAIQTFLDVMGDMRIGGIEKQTVHEFYSILEKLPPNINKLKRYQGKTIPEIVAMNEPPQAPSNIAKKMERISTMFKWAVENPKTWGIAQNPFEGFGLAKSTKMKTGRRAFKHDEIRLLLLHPSYQDKRFERSYRFWLIPLALFTGARLGELCQLEVNDFKEIDGVSCIDITDEEQTKRLKNENARRLIPIHPELIRMGLLRHVERLRQSGEKLLFSDEDLSAGHTRGKMNYASRWFNKFRHEVGLNERQTTVFHSFRNTFITTLLDKNISPHLIAPIVGHEGQLITDSVYWDKKDVKKRKETVDAFVLPSDILSLFPNVEDVTLGPVSSGKRQ